MEMNLTLHAELYIPLRIYIPNCTAQTCNRACYFLSSYIYIVQEEVSHKIATVLTQLQVVLP